MSRMNTIVMAVATAAFLSNALAFDLCAQSPDADKESDFVLLDLVDRLRRSQSAPDRKLLVNRIRKFGKSAQIATDQLIDFLDNEDEELRDLSIRTLGMIGEARSIPFIRKFLSSSSPDTRLSTAFALGRLGDTSAIPCLLNALRSPDGDVRANAAACLGFTGMQDPQAFMPLVWCLRDPEFAVRLAASGALGFYSGVEKIVPLIDVLSEGYEGLSYNAASSLDGHYQDKTALIAFDRLWNGCGDLRKKVWGAFGIVKGLKSEKAFQDLIALSRNDDPRVRANAVTAIALLHGFEDKKREEVLKSSLKDDSAETRSRSLWGLNCMNIKGMGEVYIKALEDSSSRVVVIAVRSLSLSREPESVRPLIDVLNRGELFLDYGYLRVEVYLALRSITKAEIELEGGPEQMYGKWLEWYESEGHLKFPQGNN